MTKLNEHMHMNMINVNKYMHKNRNKHLLKTLGVGIMFKSPINPHRIIPTDSYSQANFQKRYTPRKAEIT